MRTSPVYDAVQRAPWGRRCGYYRAEYLGGEIWYRRHGPIQCIGAERTDDAEMENTAGAVGDPNAVAVLWVVMAVTAFGPRGDAPRDVDDDVTPALLFHRPTMFQDDEVEMEDRVGTLQTAVHDVVGHGFLPECAEVLRDIVFRTHLDISFWALFGDPLARVEPMTVRLQPGAKAVRAKPRVSPTAHIPGDDNCWGDLPSRWVTRLRGGGLRERARQVRGGCFRRERQGSDEGVCARRECGHCGGQTHPRYGVGGGFAKLRRDVSGGTPWPPRDLGAGRGELSEKATAGVCPREGAGHRRVDATIARLHRHRGSAAILSCISR